MEVLAELFKQIGNIDSTVKLIAFLASILLLTVIAILKYSDKISKRAANIPLFLFGAVFVIALIAMFLKKIVPGNDKLTLTVTLINTDGIPYGSDQTDFNPNSKTASVDYSPQAKSWTVVLNPDELPKDRTISLFAQTKDTSSIADTLYRLTNEPFQTLRLRLQKRSIGDGPRPDGSDTTFWINLSDEGIRQAIARLTGLTYDPNSSKKKIVVTYEPSKIQRHGNIYSFVSSSPVVRIDGKWHTLDNCTIPEMEPNATRDIETMRSYAQAQSMAIATAYFRQKPEILARWIKQQ